MILPPYTFSGNINNINGDSSTMQVNIEGNDQPFTLAFTGNYFLLREQQT